MSNNGAKLIATTGLSAAVRLAQLAYNNSLGGEWNYEERTRLKDEYLAAVKLAQDVRALCNTYATQQVAPATFVLVEGGFDFLVDYDGADWAVLRGLLHGLRCKHWENIRYGNGQNELALSGAFESLHELAAAHLEKVSLSFKLLRRLAKWEEVSEWITDIFREIPQAIIWLDEWETTRTGG